MRSKYSSKSSKSPYSSSNTSVNSNKSFLKLCQGTAKAKIFADQMEEQEEKVRTDKKKTGVKGS